MARVESTYRVVGDGGNNKFYYFPFGFQVRTYHQFYLKLVMMIPPGFFQVNVLSPYAEFHMIPSLKFGDLGYNELEPTRRGLQMLFLTTNRSAYAYNDY